MRSPVVLVAVCALVLVGAYLASRMLVSEVTQPPAVVATSPGTQELAQVPSLPNAQPTARPENLEEAQRAMLAPRQGPLQAVSPQAHVPVAMDPSGVPPTADLAASPFQGDSKELDYAEALLAAPGTPLDQLQSAHQVLDRCVNQEPDNKRCQAALTVAQQRLGGRAASERQPEMPTLLGEKPEQLRNPQ
jgi:hypothetical protein